MIASEIINWRSTSRCNRLQTVYHHPVVDTRYIEATKTVKSRRKLSVPPFLIDEPREHLCQAPPSGSVFFAVEGQPLRCNSFERR